LGAAVVRHFSFESLAILALCVVLSSVAQSQQGNSQVDALPTLSRAESDRKFAAALQSIADECRAKGLEKQAAETAALNFVRDPGRLYVFLPTETTVDAAAKDVDPSQKMWQDKLRAARLNYAAELLKLATELAAADRGAEAFQLVHESLHWDPALEVARKALGHRQTDSGWQPYSERLKVKKAARDHSLTKWKSGEYLLVSTDDFEISSNADEATTVRMAEQLQRWQWIWRQVFYDYWGSAKNLMRCLEGKAQSPSQSRKFNVVFFANRDDYIQTLSAQIPGIEVSTGYYSDQLKTSFFYAAEDRSVEETWRHELTHQLFKESINTEPLPFEKNYLWLGEGIAMYMESLRDIGPWVTLGGFDGRRIQYARVRKFREDFHIPVAELNQMPLADFQRNPEIRRIYSEAAGLCHFLMHADENKYRRPLIELLELIYRGKFKPEKFEAALGIAPKTIDEQYGAFLRTTSDVISQYLAAPETITELCLPGANLADEAFRKIGECRELAWLDISGSSLTPQRVKFLVGCSKIDQLFLTRSKISPGTIEALRQFSHLSSLDLSGALIDPKAIGELAMLDGLQDLSLTLADVNDSIVPTLSKMKNLRTINLAKTKITKEGIRKLEQKLPNLKIVQRP
jgi:hypothetical protein